MNGKVEKKFLNDPETSVDEFLNGFIKAYPSLVFYPKQRALFNFQKESNKVGIISGGGAGHEPFCAGFIGRGMLTGAISGSVFASPPASNIFQAINTISKFCKGGIFVIIPNYTGDCLNFGLAIEKAKNENIKIDFIQFGDDCACLSENFSVSNDQDLENAVGRRGMCGMMFLQKIIGSMSEKGETLENISAEAKIISKSIATMGVALSSCSLPGQPLLFELKSDEIEFGIGVHGEAGIERTKMQSAKHIVEKLLNKILKTLDLVKLNNESKFKKSIVLMINNLGATSKQEEFLIVNEAFNQLSNYNLEVSRIYSAPFMTSMNMSGIQISILSLENNLHWLEHLDEKTDAPAWPGCLYSQPSLTENIFYVDNEIQTKKTNKNALKLSEKSSKILKECLIEIAKALIENENKLNNLDSGCGDGDCGTTLKKLAQEILKEQEEFIWNHPIEVLDRLAFLAETLMGGTSGAIYSLFIQGIINEGVKFVSLEFGENWAKILREGVEAIMKYSHARPGDRTMLDALVPACEVLGSIKWNNLTFVKDLDKIAEAAWNGCRNTINLIPKAGRAVYVNSGLVKDVDAGAYAVHVWVKAVVETLKKHL